MVRTMTGEDGVVYRQCRKCQDIYPLTDEFFYRSHGQDKPWLDSVCRKCRNKHCGKSNPEYARQWKQRNPDYQLNWQRANKDKIREYWRRYAEKKKLAKGADSAGS